MSRPPAHPKGWAPVPSVTSPPVSFRPATPTRHSPIHRLPPPYIPCPKPMRPTSSPLNTAPQPYRYPSPVSQARFNNNSHLSVFNKRLFLSARLHKFTNNQCRCHIDPQSLWCLKLRLRNNGQTKTTPLTAVQLLT